MASKSLIKFYKGIVLKEIHKAISKDMDVSIEDIDFWIKKNNDTNLSTTEMENIDLINICRWCFILGDELGLNLNFPDSEFP